MYQIDELALSCKEAEENVIAEIITDVDKIKYIDELDENDFYYKANKKIFELIKELKEKDKTIDMITIKEKGESKKYNGQALFETLVQISESLSFGKDIENTISIIKNLSMKRKVKSLAKKIIEEVVEIDISKDEIEVKNDIIQQFMNLKTNQKKTENEMSKVMVETVRDIEDRYNKRDDYSYRTGYLALDKIIERLT